MAATAEADCGNILDASSARCVGPSDRLFAKFLATGRAAQIWYARSRRSARDPTLTLSGIDRSAAKCSSAAVARSR